LCPARTVGEDGSVPEGTDPPGPADLPDRLPRRPGPAITDPKYLRIYLDDHLAFEAGGLGLVGRLRRTSPDGPFAEMLDRLLEDGREAQAVIRGAMAALGLRPSAAKPTIGRIGQKLGSLKLNGHLVTPSPLSRVSELEFLHLLLEHRRSLSATLVAVARKDPRLTGMDAVHLDVAARDRQEDLRPFREAAGRVAFGS
jgi:hypothetical protein